MWINPITDRTDHVSPADKKIMTANEKILATSDGKYLIVRGANKKPYLNDTDLVRIEMDIEYLSDILNGYGYNQSLTHKTDWDMADFPYASEMERIRSNIQALIDVYYPQEVPLPATLEGLDYIKLNDLENNLKLMKEMVGRMEQSFRYSGTFYSGQEVAF